MKIAIFGGTGFVGQTLVPALIEAGHSVLVFSRHPRPGFDHEKHWNPDQLDGWESELTGCAAIINLVGANIGDKRWTKRRKTELFESRIRPTRLIGEAIQKMPAPPHVFVSASAVGIYNAKAKLALPADDESTPPGTGFLPTLCHEWEQAAMAVQPVTRVVLLRSGIVLGNGGFLKKMKSAFGWGVKVVLGDGKAPFAWIHIVDLVQIILLALRDESVIGPINCVAPEITTMGEFFEHLAQKSNCFFSVSIPNLAVEWLAGEMAEILIRGPLVTPKKLLDAGYKFTYTQSRQALF